LFNGKKGRKKEKVREEEVDTPWGGKKKEGE